MTVALGLMATVKLALAVEVGQAASEGLENILDSAQVVLPGVCRRVLKIEHDAGSAGVQHFHHEISFVGRTSHLIPLVGTPLRKLDAPGICRGDRRRQVVRKLTGVRFSQGAIAA